MKLMSVILNDCIGKKLMNFLFILVVGLANQCENLYYGC